MTTREPTKGTDAVGMSQRELYNLVSDTGVGFNVRLKDNLLQAAAIGLCLLIGAVIGALVAPDRTVGALLGGFAGMVVGLFGSGIFLGVFRLIRHLRGRHD